MNPTVSIIVPVYNAKNYLQRCIDSILHQEYTDYELFLVDDGSTDGSGDICDAYAAADARITVIHKENTGVSDSRNLAISQARGTYPATGRRPMSFLQQERRSKASPFPSSAPMRKS